jgi:thymidylate synthase ThyX
MSDENVKTGAARVEELRRLRELMGTAPSAAPNFETGFYRGVEGIRVDLLDASRNPYKAMYCMATSTWGTWKTSVVRRWEDAPPEAREEVVRAVLRGQALPLAMEAPQFVFSVENLSRWSFDQIARARLGVVYASMGTRDNNHLDIAFRFHEASFRDEGKLMSLQALALHAKEVYRDIVANGRGSWQEARTALPISVVHRFSMSINYQALRGMCARRMTFSEAEDTVAVAWLLRDRLLQWDGFPLLAVHLRPGCDYSRACGYHKAHTMSEAFGCLFKSCGRNPVKSAPGKPDLDYEVADFNESCSDRMTIARQLGIRIPDAHEERPEDFKLSLRDRFLFGYEPESAEEAELFTMMREDHADPARGFSRVGSSGREVRPTSAMKLLDSCRVAP